MNRQERLQIVWETMTRAERKQVAWAAAHHLRGRMRAGKLDKRDARAFMDGARRAEIERLVAESIAASRVAA